MKMCSVDCKYVERFFNIVNTIYRNSYNVRILIYFMDPLYTISKHTFIFYRCIIIYGKGVSPEQIRRSTKLVVLHRFHCKIVKPPSLEFSDRRR